MNDLVCQDDALLETAGTLQRTRVMENPNRSIPSISSCGSDSVIRAFVTAFQMVRMQDANIYAGWANLGDQLAAVAEEMNRIDAALAAGSLS